MRLRLRSKAPGFMLQGVSASVDFFQSTTPDDTACASTTSLSNDHGRGPEFFLYDRQLISRPEATTQFTSGLTTHLSHHFSAQHSGGFYFHHHITVTGGRDWVGFELDFSKAFKTGRSYHCFHKFKFTFSASGVDLKGGSDGFGSINRFGFCY